jgi:hypothetical protein
LNKNSLPQNIRESKVLREKNIQLLASVAQLPDIDPGFYDDRVKNIFQYYSINPEELEKELQLYANELLDKGNILNAWQVLLCV